MRKGTGQAPDGQGTGQAGLLLCTARASTSEGVTERTQARLTSGHTRSTEMLQGPGTQAQLFLLTVISSGQGRDTAMAALSTSDAVYTACLQSKLGVGTGLRCSRCRVLCALCLLLTSLDESI